MRIAGWILVWLVSFWSFLLLGFPSERAAEWIAQKVGRQTNATVSIRKLHVRWNLDLGLDDVSVTAQPPVAVRFTTVTLQPKWLASVLSQPEMRFSGQTVSGGRISGSYKAGEVTVLFSDVPPKDLGMTLLPLPPSATLRGSGSLKIATTSGGIDTEIDGAPGGRQRLQIVGKDALGLAGTLRISVSAARI